MISHQTFEAFLKAVAFAAEKHKKQLRKGEEKVPYINHPIQVAQTLWEAGEIDMNLLVAALLHDTIEDTQTTPEEIESIFGKEVLSIVLEVTDDKQLDYRVRKQLQIEHAPHKSTSAKLLKLADKTCNVRDLTLTPPQNWSEERRLQYFEWAEKVVSGLRGNNNTLENLFDDWLAKGKATIKH